MSWEQLIDIYKEQADNEQAHKSSLPTACPNDGTPLQTDPRGTLYCSYDGWKYNGNRNSAY